MPILWLATPLDWMCTCANLREGSDDDPRPFCDGGKGDLGWKRTLKIMQIAIGVSLEVAIGSRFERKKLHLECMSFWVYGVLKFCDLNLLRLLAICENHETVYNTVFAQAHPFWWQVLNEKLIGSVRCNLLVASSSGYICYSYNTCRSGVHVLTNAKVA